MNRGGRYEVPKAGILDAAEMVARAGILALPMIGGPAAELFSAVVCPSLTRRRDKWMDSVGGGLLELERKIEGFKPENLSQDEAFVTTLLSASQAEMRTHQEAKLEALRNAVLNAALGNAPGEDLQLVFLNLVGSFTGWHLKILKFFDDPAAWGQTCGVNPKNHQMVYPSEALFSAFPELQDEENFCEQAFKDLNANGLTRPDASSLRMAMGGDVGWVSRTSALGKRFLAFIASPLGDAPSP